MEEAPPLHLVDAIMGWTVARHMTHDYDEVLARLARAEDIARDLGDKRRLARAISWIGNVHMLTGTASRAAPYMMEAQRLATELGDERLNLLPLFDASERLIELDPRRGVEGMAEVVRMARKQHLPDVEGHALATQSLAHARLGEYEEARRKIAEAQALAPSLAPVKEADVYIMTGFTHYEMGEVDRGLELLQKGSEMARAANAVECACVGFWGVGMGELARRDPALAIEHFRRSRGFADAGEYGLYGHRITAGTALAELMMGDEEAVVRLERALAGAREESDAFTAAMFSEQLAEALDRVGRTEEVPAHLEAAVAYYRESGMKPHEANALEALGNALDKLGRVAEASAAREEAADARAVFAGE
jgi:tetratricopeptide (TPR) repeat protein